LYENVKETFETAVSGAIENGSFQNRQKNQKSSFVTVLLMEIFGGKTLVLQYLFKIALRWLGSD